MKYFKKITSLASLFLFAVTSFSQGIYPLHQKKIIAYNMHTPTPAYYKEHFSKIEKQPINGVFLRLPPEAGRGQIFKVDQWATISEDKKDEQIQIIKSLPHSKKITDNFLMIFGASTMDWFSDKDWEVVLSNLRYCVSLAKDGGFKGICWDPESYSGHNPWKLDRQPDYKLHTYKEYYNIVRKRGASFIRNIQEIFPDVVIFSVRQLSDFQDGSTYSQHILQMKDHAMQQSVLENSFWSLHAAFTNGILDSVAQSVRLIDGNEDSYYYTSSCDFYKSVAVIKQDALALVAPENRLTYAKQVEVGQSVSSDYTGGFWGVLSDTKVEPFPYYLTHQSFMLSPHQKARWYEHNLYYALTTASEYVWLYDEKLNWWEDKNIPLGYRQALESAKMKYINGYPLGFSVEAMLLKAQDKAKKKFKKKFLNEVK